MWEQAYQQAKGEEPPRPAVEDQVAEMFPPCATQAGRVYLRAKFKDAYAVNYVKTLESNSAKRQDADKVWLPLQQEWLKAARQLDAALKVGIFPANVQDAAVLKEYGRVGEEKPVVPVSFDQGPVVAKFRGILAKNPGWDQPFQCKILGAKKTIRAADSRTKAGLAAKGKSPTNLVELDQITCEEIASEPLRIVIEVPRSRVKAKVTVDGAKAKIADYEVDTSSPLDPKLQTALEGKDTYAMKGAIIEVSGYSKLSRAEHGALAFAMLKDRGMEMQFAIKSAEYKNVWIAAFDRACADEGLTCRAGDGRAAPAVRFVSDSATQDMPIEAVESRPSSNTGGRFEVAARAADPSIASETASYHEVPWGSGVFPALLPDAKRAEKYGDVGTTLSLAAPGKEDDPIRNAFRAELAKTSANESFTCVIRDMGEETGAEAQPSALLAAALKAKDQDSKEAASWRIVCAGDDNSARSTVVLYVPTYLAWAILDGTNIKDYHLEHHGYFPPEMREKLLDVGVGTKLVVSGFARLFRTEMKFVVLGQQWDTPIWRVYFADWQCPDEGAGCTQFDGKKLPLLTAPEGIKKCEVTTMVYPPK